MYSGLCGVEGVLQRSIYAMVNQADETVPQREEPSKVILPAVATSDDTWLCCHSHILSDVDLMVAPFSTRGNP